MRSMALLNVYDQMINMGTTIGVWFWETLELLLDIMLEFLVRSMDLAIVIFYLIFQAIRFLSDMCIEATQTFTDIFRGIVQIISSISAEAVEDFATACIVVILWVSAGKFLLNSISKSNNRYNPLNLLRIFFGQKDEFKHPAIQGNTPWLKNTSRKKMNGPRKKRARSQTITKNGY